MGKTSSSIELEPKTLNQVQLTQAREVAAKVVQKLQPSEASALFTEGLIHPLKEVRNMDENRREAEKVVDCMDNAEAMSDDDNACDCRCMCPTQNPLHTNPKEPLSAPF